MDGVGSTYRIPFSPRVGGIVEFYFTSHKSGLENPHKK